MTDGNDQNRSQPKIFELGLVMAGAVSAGAYTAGVLDFLIQALDEWQKAKEAGQPDCPPHQVKIEVMAGASAGGMTAALAAAQLQGEITPVTQTPPTAPVRNKLYESWVEKIDIKQLLGSRDLAGEQSVKSLLDSTVLDDIAEDAFDVQLADVPRRYVDDELHLYLSLSNLRGVPYNISFGGQTQAGHGLSLHADYMHFVVSKDQRAFFEPGLWLDPTDFSTPNWQTLKQAALATGAFPVGIAPRILMRRAKDYGLRRWPIPLAVPRAADDGPARCQELREIPPDWPRGFQPDESGKSDYTFLCVDGGLMNNEPLELARRQLAGPRGRNPRGAEEANGAVILIDPFPNYATFSSSYTPQDDILSVITGMFSSLRHQAMFKPDELMLAWSNDVFSRFLIAPSRREEDGSEAAFPLACGVLNGFGGFLSVDFRRHDFQLGRRNCQQFLRKYFSLAADNPLFADWSDELKELYRIERNNGEAHLPIIPLLGPTVEEIQSLPWPRYTQAQLDDLAGRVEVRAKVIGGKMIEKYVPGWLNLVARFLWWRKRGEVVERIMERIRTDLAARKLLVTG